MQAMQTIKALFLDRDGTLIYDELGGYIRTIEQVRLVPRVEDALAAAKEAGYKLVLVTNQAGIAKGIVTEERVREINDYLQARLREKGAELDLCYYAPSHPDHPHPKYDQYASWRKPETGMVEQAIVDFQAKGWTLDHRASYFIGDKQVDVECGLRAGLRSILVMTGYGELEKCRQRQTLPEFVAQDIYEAILGYVLKNEPCPAA